MGHYAEGMKTFAVALLSLALLSSSFAQPAPKEAPRVMGPCLFGC